MSKTVQGQYAFFIFVKYIFESEIHPLEVLLCLIVSLSLHLHGPGKSAAKHRLADPWTGESPWQCRRAALTELTVETRGLLLRVLRCAAR